MSKFDSWVDHKVVQNIFVWCCLFLVLVGGVQSENSVLTAFYMMLFLVPTIYISNYFILPFFKNNKTVFFTLFLLLGALFTLIPVYLINISYQKSLTLNMFLNLFGFVLLAMIFGMAIKIARDSFKRRQEEKEAELKLLKAQLNPHFLFNTLNNLYGLSVVKSDKLPDLMLKLSNLLRYSLYETREVFVPLEKEIDYLKNYISLEKIRLDEQAEIQLSIEGEIQGKEIAPMLLIVFVENAFKHLSIEEKQKSEVIINLKYIENQLRFTCKNTYEEGIEKEENMEKGKSGIGLANAKKRLNLIYPNTHSLSVKKQKGYFLVGLTLTI